MDRVFRRTIFARLLGCSQVRNITVNLWACSATFFPEADCGFTAGYEVGCGNRWGQYGKRDEYKDLIVGEVDIRFLELR